MSNDARTFVRVGHYVHELLAGRPVIVGRSAKCDVTLDEEMASRQHCRLELVEGVVLVTDLESRNGILLNGQRVRGSCEAYHGDVLNIGPTTLSVLRQRHSPPGRELDRRPAPTEGATSRGASVVDILAAGAEDALRVGDLLAAEASARNLLTAMRGRSTTTTTPSRDAIERAIAITMELAEQTGDRSLLDKALELADE